MTPIQPEQHPLFRGYLTRRQRLPGRPNAFPCRRETAPADVTPLLLSSEADPTMAHVKNVADKLGTPTRWITYESVAAGSVPFPTVQEAVEATPGIYIRHPFSESPDITVVTTCVDALTRFHRNVIRPSTVSTNWSKPLHSHRLRSCRVSHALKVVTSRITNDPYRNSSTLCKGMSHLPTIAIRLSDAEWPRSLGPYMTQTLLSGDEFRLHVLDEKVFCCAIQKTELGVDYRSATSLHTTEAAIPSEISQCVIALSRAEGLRFSGIDIIQTQNSYYALLEVNPMPGFHCYDPHPSFPIASALVATLSDSL